MSMLDKNRANVVFVDCPFFLRHSQTQETTTALCLRIVYSRGVQPFVIAGRITFIYMKYDRQ